MLKINRLLTFPVMRRRSKVHPNLSTTIINHLDNTHAHIHEHTDRPFTVTIVVDATMYERRVHKNKLVSK